MLQSLKNTLQTSAQAGPIVSHKNRVARIRGIVLHAGGLACNKPFETDLPFKAGDILRRVIRNTRNRVTISDEMPRSQIDHRTCAGTKKLPLRFAWLWRMLG